MDRMASHTKEPDVLREIFNALGNNAFVIAECLARPVLAEGLLRKIHDDYQEPLDSRRGSAENQKRKPVAAVTGGYTLPIISTGPNGCVDDTWTATSTTNAPSARAGQTAVWTGSEMIVWGGGGCRPYLCEHRREVQSQHRQLDSHQHHQRARCPGRPHGSVDWQ